LLSSAEAKIVTPEVMNHFVANFFDKLKDALQRADFEAFFTLEFTEHEKFRERTAERFLIDILSREKRPDDFVRAEISREKRRKNPLLGSAMAYALSGLYTDEEYVELYDLELNVKMARAQLRVTLTPKFSTLQRIVLVVTCAPSLETCYVFEVATQHMLHDFGKYNEDGSKVVQRWYKFDWKESTAGVVRKITDALAAHMKTHIENTAKRLGVGS
jgi:hypothetical protein